MLSCQDCEKYLEASLDNALEVKESLDVEEHLRSCSSCAHRAEAEQTLRHFVRRQTQTPPLPEELKRRIIHQAMQPQPAPSRWQWLRRILPVRDFAIGVVAAAVVLLAFGLFFSPSAGENRTQKFVREASMTYGTYLIQHIPPEVTSTDDKVVTQWFNRRMGYRLKIPCITDKATKLVGGRLCRLFDRKSAVMIYERDGADLLLFAFKGGSLTLPTNRMVRAKDRVLYLQNIAGRPVAMWQHGGITYSMVGDVDRDVLLQVATTIDYR
ncbi:hypothetical protein NKDENANG_02301 [Candidatus Entotheonellaceae bacterium PAL068K]